MYPFLHSYFFVGYYASIAVSFKPQHACLEKVINGQLASILMRTLGLEHLQENNRLVNPTAKVWLFSQQFTKLGQVFIP